MNKLPTIGQLRQLIGNPGVYATQAEDGDGYYPVYHTIDASVLKQHLDGTITIGTYLLHGDKARTLVFDVDNLGSDQGLESVPSDEIGRIHKALVELGVPPRCMGIEFSGSKGHHLWVVMSALVDASKLRRLGQAAIAVAEVDCEVFPKQNKASKLGNLVKLPGGVHRKTGKRAEMVTPWPIPLGPAVLDRILEQVPEAAIGSVGGEAPPALECMAAIQEGPTKGWRNHGLFHYATMLYRSSLTSTNVRSLVEAANAKASPKPLDPAEIDQLLQSAAHSGPICSTLPKDVQCSECPVRRGKGLYCKAGQLTHGGAGELAVVEIGKRRKSGEVELLHPDLDFGLVHIKNVPPRGNK